MNCATRIWSGEHSSWWYITGSGYTQDYRQAGVVHFKKAYEISSHCGPEKRIMYELTGLTWRHFEEMFAIMKNDERVKELRKAEVYG